MRIVGGSGFGGGFEEPQLGQQKDCPPETRRYEAFRLALEWVRSAGQEHCTRLPIEDVLDAARCIHDYLRDGAIENYLVDESGEILRDIVAEGMC